MQKREAKRSHSHYCRETAVISHQSPSTSFCERSLIAGVDSQWPIEHTGSIDKCLAQWPIEHTGFDS